MTTPDISPVEELILCRLERALGLRSGKLFDNREVLAALRVALEAPKLSAAELTRALAALPRGWSADLVAAADALMYEHKRGRAKVARCG